MARAADVMVETLRSHGVDRVFCVPGESYLAAIDALFDAKDIDVVTTRHEGGAGFMAVADAKMTGRPGVAMVSRGPGATNASIGVHVAQQDAVPVVLFVGQVARQDIGRGAFQEVDYTQTFGDMAKWVAEVVDADKLPETIRRAFNIAQSGTPGPVVISLAEDMLLDDTDAPALGGSPVVQPVPDSGDIMDLCDRIAKAERPVLIAGGQIGGETGRAVLQAVSEAWNLPVAVAWRRQDLFDSSHPNFACHFAFNIPPHFKNKISEADLLVAVGTRLGDVTTQGYNIPNAPTPKQPLVHVYNDPSQLGRIFDTELAIVADATATLQAMAQINAPEPPKGRAEWIKEANALSADLTNWEWRQADDGVVFGNVMSHLAEVMDDDVITASDAGNFATWVQRLYPYKPANIQMGAIAGAMGMGVPGAVAASLRQPDRQVVCFVGDGGFQMTGNEMSIAVERNLPIRIIVSNNGSLGTIRLYQEKNYPDRTIATNLPNPDFAKVADAYGVASFKIESDDDIKPIIAQAFDVDGPSLVEVKTSLEYISAFTTITNLREAHNK